MKLKDTKELSKVQGEGDYEAARRYRQDVERFVQQSDIEELARAAKPETKAKREELENAEAEGLARKRGESPASGQPRPTLADSAAEVTDHADASAGR